MDKAYLKPTDERVVYFILEEGRTLVVVTGPTPHILAISIGFTTV